MGIIYSKNYSIRKELFNKIFIQNIWKLFIQKIIHFFEKLIIAQGYSNPVWQKTTLFPFFSGTLPLSRLPFVALIHFNTARAHRTMFLEHLSTVCYEWTNQRVKNWNNINTDINTKSNQIWTCGAIELCNDEGIAEGHE